MYNISHTHLYYNELAERSMSQNFDLGFSL